MDPFSIAAAIAGIIALAGGVGSKVKQTKDQRMQQEYEKNLKRQQEEEMKKKVALSNKDARKAAISRAISSEVTTMPRMETYTPTPEAPTPNPVDIGGFVQGVAGGVSQIAGGLAKQNKTNYPNNAITPPVPKVTVPGSNGRKPWQTDFNQYNEYPYLS